MGGAAPEGSHAARARPATALARARAALSEVRKRAPARPCAPHPAAPPPPSATRPTLARGEAAPRATRATRRVAALAGARARVHIPGCQSAQQHSKFYDAELEPWVHYVPIKEDLSDLEEKVLWARAHDAEVRAVAERGTRFARERLSMQDVLEYERLALEELRAMLPPAEQRAAVRLEGCRAGDDAKGCWGDAEGRAPRRPCAVLRAIAESERVAGLAPLA